MKINEFLYILFISIVIGLVTGCGGSEQESSKQQTSPKVTPPQESVPNTKYLGEWRYIQTNIAIEIDASTDTTKYSQLDNDILQEHSENGNHAYLVQVNKKVAPPIQVTGSVANLQDAQVPASGEVVSQGQIDVEQVLIEDGRYGVEIVLEDLRGMLDPLTTRTGNNGEFSIGSINRGNYTVIGRDPNDPESVYFEYELEITGDPQDIGISTVVEATELKKYNFKSLIGTKDPYVFADYQTYSATFQIQNIGTERALGLNYKFDCSDPAIMSCKFNNILGTIEVGKSANIPFEIAFNFINSNSKQVKIPVQITDALGNQWTDYGIINVYKKPMLVTFKTADAMSSYFLTLSPENKILFQGVNSIGKVNFLPYFPGEEYRILTASRNQTNEAAYSISVDTGVDDLRGFSDTSRHEPNENYENAAVIKKGDAISSYLYFGDLDYFRISMPAEGVNLDPYSFSFEARSDFYDRKNTHTIGNGDGKLNPGETVAFDISAKNNGASRAQKISYRLSTDDPYVTITNKYERYIPYFQGLDIRDSKNNYPGSSLGYLKASADNTYFMSVANDPAALGHIAVIKVVFEDGQGNQWFDSFDVTIE